MTTVWIRCDPPEDGWFGFMLEHVTGWTVSPDEMELWTTSDRTPESGFGITRPEDIARVCELLGMPDGGGGK